MFRGKTSWILLQFNYGLAGLFQIINTLALAAMTPSDRA